MLYFALATPNLSGLATDNNGNTIETSVTINVQAQTSTPPPSGLTLSVSVIAPTAQSENPSTPHTPTSNPIVNLQGTVSGGTPPYTATWTAQYQGSFSQYEGQTYTIASLSSKTLLPAGSPPFPDDDWSVCNTFANSAGEAVVSLSATASNGATGQGVGPSVIYFNCEVAQSIPQIPVEALVSLLTLLFTVTAERKTILESKPWFKNFHRLNVISARISPLWCS